MHSPDALLLIGHGSRSEAGVAEYWEFFAEVHRQAGEFPVGGGFIELAQPDLDTAVDKLVADGASGIVGVPLVLLGAGHLKNDGPAALARGRTRHPGVRFTYGRDLGIHPLVLEVAEERMPDRGAVVLVSRGSSDPDANADLYKVARLLQDRRGLDIVEPAFVSLAPPGVPVALERCRRLGAEHVTVVPYFLFTGVLVDRIGEQAAAWADAHTDVDVRVGRHLGADPRIARLVVDRYHEAVAGDARMNCDLCVYRTDAPVHVHSHSHSHSHAERR